MCVPIQHECTFRRMQRERMVQDGDRVYVFASRTGGYFHTSAFLSLLSLVSLQRGINFNKVLESCSNNQTLSDIESKSCVTGMHEEKGNTFPPRQKNTLTGLNCALSDIMRENAG